MRTGRKKNKHKKIKKVKKVKKSNYEASEDDIPILQPPRMDPSHHVSHQRNPIHQRLLELRSGAGPSRIRVVSPSTQDELGADYGGEVREGV